MKIPFDFRIHISGLFKEALPAFLFTITVAKKATPSPAPGLQMFLWNNQSSL